MKKVHTLTKEDIYHLAKLASLSLTEEEIVTYQTQLSEMLSYVKKLEEVDTSNVASTSHTTNTTNIMSDDTLSDERMLKSLEHLEVVEVKGNQYFKVRRIM